FVPGVRDGLVPTLLIASHGPADRRPGYTKRASDVLVPRASAQSHHRDQHVSRRRVVRVEHPDDVATGVDHERAIVALVHRATLAEPNPRGAVPDLLTKNKTNSIGCA